MPSTKDPKSNNKKSNTKFDEIHKKNLELLKERVEKLENSDDDECDENVADKLKIDLLKKYKGDENDVAKILENLDGDSNDDCLICIRKLKIKDKIWSCDCCFYGFHLLCIQKWANDSMNQKKLWYDNQPNGYYDNLGNYIKKKELRVFWDCPACRKEYQSNEIPRHYLCYCSKEIDPIYQEWIFPHSCGQICGKKLEPICGHTCTLFCHPGKCPPCPQTIQTSCLCKKSNLKTIRCSQKTWTCLQKCSKKLSCGIHICDSLCHSECPPCKKKSVKKCFCGKNSKEIKCEQESFNCQKVCGKNLSCGNHTCEKTCHSSDCGECPYGFERSCFCGKQNFSVTSCDEKAFDSCGDTCFKKLSCGHKCLSRCHKGVCPSCMVEVEKKCRCGISSKIVPCSKELLCETKCNKIKECKKHSCKARCCVDCAPCNVVCGKTLSCGRHKCEAFCHYGNCYPCAEKQKISCRCGATSIMVRCGKGNKNKFAKCKELCKIPTKCHHEAIPHKCHTGECPNCKQICDEILPCDHPCSELCHDYVKTIIKDKNFVPTGPWEKAGEKIVFKKLPHPPCKVKVPVTCTGGHETILMNCSDGKISSCGRNCGRKLSCGNHNCQKECHQVNDINSMEQDENCEECTSPCIKERPFGCTHSCPRPCHDLSKPCKKCIVQIKTKCFCGLTDVYYRCCDVNKRDIDDATREALRDKFLCCGARCIKIVSI